MVLMDIGKLIVILMIFERISAVSYNRPKFCPNATWNSNAKTLADSSVVGINPYEVFVTKNNTIYVASQTKNRILIWSNANDTSPENITGIWSNPVSLFVTTDYEMYVADATSNDRVDKWDFNQSVASLAMYVCSACYDLFVINNMLYCSMMNSHQIIAKPLDHIFNPFKIVAGTGVAGSNSSMLRTPYGIFVDTNFDLYVADFGNNRVQLFRLDETNGQTVAGSPVSNPITLDCPTAVVLDADKYLFVADSSNHRIVGSGPNGFRCLVGCPRSPGSNADQLNQPMSLSFDSYGNIFVADKLNNRIQKFILATNSCEQTTASQTKMTSTLRMQTSKHSIPSTGSFRFTSTVHSATATPLKAISYNRPNLSDDAVWNPNAIEFNTGSVIGSDPYGFFVDISDNVFVTVPTRDKTFVWLNGSGNPPKTIYSSSSRPRSVFALSNGDLYFDNGGNNGRVDYWMSNTNSTVPAMYVADACFGLFIDMRNTLYCSLKDLNRVVSKSLNTSSNLTTVVAGIGCAGSTSYMLSGPHGIFVEKNFDLYVADSGNNRIQLFKSGQSNASTIVGNGTINTITLNYPTHIILDANKNLYIVDKNNHRIVCYGPNGFRCLVGCFPSGSASNQLLHPHSMAFDSAGNMLVVDQDNQRIQKFILLNKTLTRSYNQPKFCPSTTWYPNAITFVPSGAIPFDPIGIFINTKNTIYVSSHADRQIFVWPEGNITSWTNISVSGYNLYHMFVTTKGDGYVNSGNHRITKWTVNSTKVISIDSTSDSCYGISVDISDTLYCSISSRHKVVKKWLGDSSNVSTIVAGTGTAGSSSSMLHNPYGIFVGINFDLYVADCGNDRVQRFRSGQSDGQAIAGRTAVGTITLNCPIAVILDADRYLFIVDHDNYRVVGSGPNGFRCLVGCSGSRGSAANQLNNPQALSFDSYGNIYVADTDSDQIRKFILATNSCELSYNQPTFCPDALWNLNASTFASSSTVGSGPYGLFISGTNDIYITNPSNSRIIIWSQGSLNPTTYVLYNSSQSYGIFATINGEVYFDDGFSHGRVSKWSYSSNTSETVMNVNGSCYDLFIDNNKNLYCALGAYHKIIQVWLSSNSSTPTLRAGNGSHGSASNLLSLPLGIYVDRSLNLYVADCGNDRIQFFRPNQSNGTTIPINDASGPMTLDCPTDIVLDAAENLFIVDQDNHRIIGSGSRNGFRCIVGCSNSNVSSSFNLLYPRSMAFDSFGNIFVVDTGNHRIQKFDLMNNSCERLTTEAMTTIVTEAATTSESPTTSSLPIVNQTCLLPKIILIPASSSFSSPLQFRRSQDFSISSDLQYICNTTYPVTIKWFIRNCTTNCSFEVNLNGSVETTFAELYIPGRTLPYGFYRFELFVQSVYSSNLSISSSAYAKINPSGITANLIQLGTSMITRGSTQDLLLDPGSYSVDPDESSFDAKSWIYKYYCRIYGVSKFPNVQGLLITLDDPNITLFNSSCLSTRPGNGTSWRYTDSIQSSITILGNSLQSNRTYQFMVQMFSRKNASQQATGYVLVQVEDTRPQLIVIGCVIWTLCVPNMEYQRVNPTTQVALFGICIGNCTTLQSIHWEISSGEMNTSSNFTNWILYNQTNDNNSHWFFGANTSNFTATNQLFLQNPNIHLWKFQVFYTFAKEISSSSLNFIINVPPANGSCSIYPFNGTIDTLFTVTCLNWFDDDNIKDYLLYFWTDDPTTTTFIAYSFVTQFQVRLPAGDLHLIIHIRDTADCVTEYHNLSSVTIRSNSVETLQLMNNITNSSANSVIQLLSSQNQNTVGQVISSVSQQLNTLNNRTIDQVVSNGIAIASISISPLGSRSKSQNSTSLNTSAYQTYNENLNTQSNAREYLIQYLKNLLITTPNSIKLQSSSLAELTQSTNQLTRQTLQLALDRCYQLTSKLKSFSVRIPYEETRFIATNLLRCGTNLLTAVNGPLQQRTDVLRVDTSRANAFPEDYDTDIESEWSNLNLLTDGGDVTSESLERDRNIYQQKKLSNEITAKVHQMMSLLTSTLHLHINIGQNCQVNTSEIFMSMETLSAKSLSNKSIEQVANARIQLPLNFTVNQNGTISLRSMIKPLASYGNARSQPNTNLSTSISLTMLDQNGDEILPIINMSNPIAVTIPRDPNLSIPSMIIQNVTSLNSTPHNQYFQYHYMNITSSFSISAHIEFRPLNTSLTYLFIYKFDDLPQWNYLDGWTTFDPSNLSNDSIYKYFIDNQRTAGHRSVLFGIRELSANELLQFRTKSSSTYPPAIEEKLNFTSDYELRLYTSGCYYLDENNNWQSDNMLVGSETNHYQTQCYTTQLKTFASGLVFLPKAIDWQYVFANADFMKNKTIYLTVISVLVIYLILMIFARYKDRKDLEKLGVTPLADNHQDDRYFYQILVFTGQRKDAGTNSKVHFLIGGDNDQTQVRTLSDPHRKILQRGSIDSFIMAVPKSLGLLNYIRIWHDNSGRGSSASWFLKYIIVRDLQTMEKFYFIAQRWFAVEKDDGKIERTLAFANDHERQEFSYLLSKKTYHSISDGHLWFSIFSRPPSNRFTRVQRCTCCFVLLIFSMFLNIMYYQTLNESKTNNSTNTVGISMGPLYLSTQQIIIGIIVEVFAFIPSLLLIQFFRRIRTRRPQISPLRQALYSLRSRRINVKTRKRKTELTFPWWCLFIAYGFCVIIVSMSILFIIARGIEFGDLKSQQWLTSIISGLFSSIFLTEPIKIICLSIFFAFFCRKDNDQELNEYIDEDDGDLEDNEEYLHLKKKKSLFTYRPRVEYDRLNEVQVTWARQERFKEIQMWSIIREFFSYFALFILLSFIVYSNQQSNSYVQVQHLRKYFLNTRQIDNSYHKICTIDDYWKWLEQSFTSNLRAQQWYNKAAPRNLTGYINDKSNRLIGWATIRQLRIKSHPCSQLNFRSNCLYDYHISDEDQDSYQPGWTNQTDEDYSSTIIKAFAYQSSDQLNTYTTIGDHGNYAGGGYVYEFRGRLSEMQGNLSILHRLSWIDNHTRAVIIQLTLYNPNVQLFTSLTFLAEFLSVGGIFSQARFEPLDLINFRSLLQLICSIIYMLFIIYLMFTEIRSLFHLKWNYFRQFWSFIEWGIIICSWSCLGIYIWRYQESNRIYSLFKQTNGYVYINLQFAGYINDLLMFFFAFCVFFGTLRLVRLCRYDQRLTLFTQTLKGAAQELISFSLMFSFVFFAFLFLFYFLFISQIASCSTLLATAQMLFEMSLLKFDTSDLLRAAPFLGPLCFTLFIFLVVFVCMSMFLSIINDHFRSARDNMGKDKESIFAFMWYRFVRTTGLKKPTEEEIFVERDARMRREYIDPIESFPDKIDQLLNALNRIYMDQRRALRLDI